MFYKPLGTLKWDRMWMVKGSRKVGVLVILGNSGGGWGRGGGLVDSRWMLAWPGI